MEFTNKVAESGIITLDLEKLQPAMEVVGFDLQPFLFMGLILKEKDYRAALQTHDWVVYQGKAVALHCSADAIIPHWAYMLAATHLKEVAATVRFGTPAQVKEQLLQQAIDQLPAEDYADKRVVIKGCGEEAMGPAAYAAITWKLLPVAKSIMYGEPCSTVPVYKQKKVLAPAAV